MFFARIVSLKFHEISTIWLRCLCAVYREYRLHTDEAVGMTTLLHLLGPFGAEPIHRSRTALRGGTCNEEHQLKDSIPQETRILVHHSVDRRAYIQNEQRSVTFSQAESRAFLQPPSIFPESRDSPFISNTSETRRYITLTSGPILAFRCCMCLWYSVEIVVECRVKRSREQRRNLGTQRSTRANECYVYVHMHT